VLIRIGNEFYLLECQSFEDGLVEIMIAKYDFIATRKFVDRGKHTHV
jgi:hypothetical protein